MLIFPAIDLIGGRTVRLTQGDYDRKTDYDLDPVEVAVAFRNDGAEWLHVVDLDGAKAGRPMNLDVLKRIADVSGMNIEFGGGLRDVSAIEAALYAGAKRVILGSRLAQDLEFARSVFATYGESVVAGIDTRDGKVSVQGWREDSGADGVTFARTLVDLGCRRIIATDIARDGSLDGPNLDWLATIIAAVAVPVIASGGVASLADIAAIGALPAPGVEGVIVGKALYEGRFTVAQVLNATRFVVS